jgi:hypothetical protein
VRDGTVVSAGMNTGRIMVNTWDGQMWELLAVKATRLLKSEKGQAKDLRVGDWVVAAGLPTKLTVGSLTADKSAPPPLADEGGAGESSSEPSAASTVSGFDTVVSVGGNVTSTNPLKIQETMFWVAHSKAPREVELDVPAGASVWRVVDGTREDVVKGAAFAGTAHMDGQHRLVLDSMTLGDTLQTGYGGGMWGGPGGGGGGRRYAGGLLGGRRPGSGGHRGGSGRLTYEGGTIVSADMTTGRIMAAPVVGGPVELYALKATRLLRNEEGQAADLQVGDWVETDGVPANLAVMTLTADKSAPPPPAAEGEEGGPPSAPLDMGMVLGVSTTASVGGQVSSTNPLKIREMTLGADGSDAPREVELDVPAGADVRLLVDGTREEVVKGAKFVGEARRDSQGRLVLDTMILGRTWTGIS